MATLHGITLREMNEMDLSEVAAWRERARLRSGTE
ncbi:GpE family phage tail protein [Cupriavidus sp. UGS-1]|nr:GpE family phage tail protein [Cupriavidus sp. UGS-1]